MSLIEYTIDGKIDKVEQAIKRIQLGALSPEPLYVCYSGGKDSKVLRRLMEMSGVQYELHYNMTTVDIPSVVREILNDRDVIVDKAMYADGRQKTMWNLIVKNHFPPTRLCRYCCSQLKEVGGKGRICVTGVRKAESVRRAKQGAEAKILTKSGATILNLDNDEHRRTIELCYRTQKTLINPILDWTEEDVWEFSKCENIQQNPLYKKCGGTKTRLGCILCPMKRLSEKEQDIKDYPKFAEAYVKTFDRLLDNLPDKSKVVWKNGQDVFDWWLYGNQYVDSNQLTLEDFE